MSECGGYERLIRTLQRGGCLAPYRRGWGVWRSGDLRRSCIGQLPDRVVASLTANGEIGPAPGGGGRLTWRGPVSKDMVTARRRPKTPRPGRQRRPARSALQQVLDELPSETGRGRVVAAANRLAADAERAAAAQSVTMRWDEAGKVDGGRGWGEAGAHIAAQRAERRLSTVRARLGAGAYGALLELVVYGRSLPAIARGAMRARSDVAGWLADGLARLADAYDEMAAA